MPPDAFDAALSALHTHVENLAAWIAIWQARTEPDGHARRCGSDAVDALDAIVTQAYRLRARLIAQIRISDRLAADRVDALLARTSDGRPRYSASEAAHKPRSAPPPPPSSEPLRKELPMSSISRSGDSGRAPGEVSP